MHGQAEILLKDLEMASTATHQADKAEASSSLTAMLLHEASSAQQLLHRVQQDCLMVLRSSCLTEGNSSIISSLGSGKVCYRCVHTKHGFTARNGAIHFGDRSRAAASRAALSPALGSSAADAL